MSDFGALWRLFACLLTGWAAGIGVAALMPHMPESQGLLVGAACGITGVVLGLMAGMLWVAHREGG